MKERANEDHALSFDGQRHSVAFQASRRLPRVLEFRLIGAPSLLENRKEEVALPAELLSIFLFACQLLLPCLLFAYSLPTLTLMVMPLENAHVP